MRDFDPVRLGNAEADAWVYYYLHRWGQVLRALLVMVRVGFGLSWPDTIRGGWWVLRANQVWAPFPDNDPAAARAYMQRFYTLVARRSKERFDPVEAARLEVEWWRVHRAAQHGGGTFEEMVDAIAALYGYVYAVPVESVHAAALGRAEGARISDQWVADGSDPDSPAIAEERAALVRGYSALLAAVAAPTGGSGAGGHTP